MRLAITESLAVVGAAVLLTACGSRGSAGATASSNSQFALAHCMRSHGVPNFPDPTVSSGGTGFSIVATPGSSAVTVDGTMFSGPAFQSASTACGFVGPGKGPGITEAQKKAFIAKARCIRRHGVPSFPDPFFAPGGHGVGINLGPGLSGDSPAIRHAAKACAGVGAGIPGTET